MNFSAHALSLRLLALCFLLALEIVTYTACNSPSPVEGNGVDATTRLWRGGDTALLLSHWGPYQFWDYSEVIVPVVPKEDSLSRFTGEAVPLGGDAIQYSYYRDSSRTGTQLRLDAWIWSSVLSRDPEHEGTLLHTIWDRIKLAIPQDAFLCIRDTIQFYDRENDTHGILVHGESPIYQMKPLRPWVDASSPAYRPDWAYDPTITWNGTQRTRQRISFMFENLRGDGCIIVPAFPLTLTLYGKNYLNEEDSISATLHLQVTDRIFAL